MYGAVIHDTRRESASTYFGTQSEAGNVEVALQLVKKKGYKPSHALKMLHRLLNKTEVSKGSRHIEISIH